MSSESTYDGFFEEELGELQIHNFRVISQAALLEAADELKQGSDEFPGMDDRELQRFLRQASRLQRRERLLQGAKAFYRTASKVAIVLLVLMAGGIFAAVNVEAIRMPLINWLIDVQETHTSIQFLSDGNELPEVEFGYLPEGYVLESIDKSVGGYMYYITDLSGKLIVLVHTNLNSGISLDTENADVSNMVLENGVSILVAEKDGWIQVVWANNIGSFSLSGENNLEELVKIAENIKIVE